MAQSENRTGNLFNYSLTGHTHDEYSLTGHTHNEYAAQSSLTQEITNRTNADNSLQEQINAISGKTLSGDFLPLSGGTMTGDIKFTDYQTISWAEGCCSVKLDSEDELFKIDTSNNEIKLTSNQKITLSTNEQEDECGVYVNNNKINNAAFKEVDESFTVPSDSTKLPTTKAVSDIFVIVSGEVKNIREVAEGKTASYVISGSTAPSPWNSTADTVTATTLQITGKENGKIRTGDIVLIEMLNVPDRWAMNSGSGDTLITLGKLETTKVELSEYATKTSLSNYIPLAGTTGITGSLIPSNNSSYNLGTSDKAFNTIYSISYNCGKYGQINEEGGHLYINAKNGRLIINTIENVTSTNDVYAPEFFENYVSLKNKYAAKSHTHNEYAAQSSLTQEITNRTNADNSLQEQINAISGKTLSGDFLPLSGGTMTGDIKLNNKYLLVSEYDQEKNSMIGVSKGSRYLGLYSYGNEMTINYGGQPGNTMYINARETLSGYSNPSAFKFCNGNVSTFANIYANNLYENNVALSNKYSQTGHTHSQYSLTGHTHSQYSLTGHTHNYLPLTGGNVNGTIYAQAFYESSDKRLKNIHGDIDLNKAYNLIDKCSTILYDLKDDVDHKKQIGVIAQEVQEFFPEIVIEDTNGMLSVDYSRLTVVILKVLKDLINRVQKIELY